MMSARDVAFAQVRRGQSRMERGESRARSRRCSGWAVLLIQFQNAWQLTSAATWSRQRQMLCMQYSDVVAAAGTTSVSSCWSSGTDASTCSFVTLALSLRCSGSSCCSRVAFHVGKARLDGDLLTIDELAHAAAIVLQARTPQPACAPRLLSLGMSTRDIIVVRVYQRRRNDHMLCGHHRSNGVRAHA